MIYAAGILFYSYDEKGNTVFLLGKDYRNKYSDFGGRNDPTDITSIDTAARECYEETCGVVYDSCILKYKLHNAKVIHSLSYLKNPYYMFPLYIPYSKEYIYNFDIMRKYIQNKKIDKKFKEKLELQWFTINEIINDKDSTRQVFFRTFIKNIDVINIITTRKVLKH